jgi:hypothetical protein
MKTMKKAKDCYLPWIDVLEKIRNQSFFIMWHSRSKMSDPSGSLQKKNKLGNQLDVPLVRVCVYQPYTKPYCKRLRHADRNKLKTQNSSQRAWKVVNVGLGAAEGVGVGVFHQSYHRIPDLAGRIIYCKLVNKHRVSANQKNGRMASVCNSSRTWHCEEYGQALLIVHEWR